MSAPLLDAAFVRELEALRRRLQIRARSGSSGEHMARRRGGSTEFHEHRSYSAGDSLRRIDWAAYARSGTPVVKVFRAEEDLLVRLLCDASASMRYGEPSKLSVAQRLAAAVGYMALASSERAQLLVASAGRLRSQLPRRGRGGLPPLLQALDAVQAEGATELDDAITKAVMQSGRPGMLVVLSDFFDAGPVMTALSRAASAGHDVALVQVVAREEVEPRYDGDWALEDAESGELVELTMDPTALAAYEARFAGLCEELRRWARRHAASYVRVCSDETLADAVRRIVAREID